MSAYATAASWFSTGRPELDAILGGGLPAGRLVELFGDRASITAILGPVVGAMSSHCVDSTLDAVAMLDRTLSLVTHGTKLVVVDATALAKAPMYSPRLLSNAARKLCPLCTRHGATVVFVRDESPAPTLRFTQWWERQGQPSDTGNALKYFCSVRAKVTVADDGTRVRTYKNKLCPPFQTVTLATIGA